jgi:hypothetical protein
MSFTDKTDTLAGGSFRRGSAQDKRGLVIQFYHIPTFKAAIDQNLDNGAQATFKAFLTNFKDNFKVNWSAKDTLGRMDPIQTYKNTQRQISIGFDVPSHSKQEAALNFVELQKLIMMQYPVYETINFGTLSSPAAPSGAPPAAGQDREMARNMANKADGALTSPSGGTAIAGKFISSPPLLYIKFLNWISEDVSMEAGERLYYAHDSLVGVIDNVSFEPDLEAGFHFTNSEFDGSLQMIPKTFSLNLNINIIHTQDLGWTNINATGDKYHVFGSPKGDPNLESYPIFPYKVGTYEFDEDT